MNSDKENWRTIPGYSDYMVSDQGRVKSLKKKKELVLKPSKPRSGYLKIPLWENKKQKSFYVHQLVAIAFLDHVPNRLVSVIDHINGNILDNRLENLRIVSQRENTILGFIKKKTSSKYTGVGWYPRYNKWISSIYFNKKRIHLGYFSTEKEAGQAYQDKLKELNGLRD